MYVCMYVCICVCIDIYTHQFLKQRHTDRLPGCADGRQAQRPAHGRRVGCFGGHSRAAESQRAGIPSFALGASGLEVSGCGISASSQCSVEHQSEHERQRCAFSLSVLLVQRTALCFQEGYPV